MTKPSLDKLSRLPCELPDDPLPIFCAWLDAAAASRTMTNPDAMTVATITNGDQVAARIVLCKEIVADPGYLVFFTNYESDKGQQILANANVAAVFYWDALGRQVRIEGIVSKSPETESEQYFASRDRDSRIGAWTSAQSRPIGSHQELLDKHARTEQKFNEPDPNGDIPRPAHWGGYRIGIRAIELWQQGNARLHDRARWERRLKLVQEAATFDVGPWRATRLQP